MIGVGEPSPLWVVPLPGQVFLNCTRELAKRAREQSLSEEARVVSLVLPLDSRPAFPLTMYPSVVHCDLEV